MQERSRLEGFDLAWLLALAGIIVLPVALSALFEDPQHGGWPLRLLDGPPLALFAMLFGIDLERRAAPRLVAGDRDGAMRAALARGLWIGLLGSLLTTISALLSGVAAASLFVGAVLPTGGAVLWVPDITSSGDLLGPLGVALLLAAPLLAVPTWALAVAAVLLVALHGPLVAYLSLQPFWAQGIEGYGFLAVFVRDVLFAGPYPALTLLTLVGLGMLARRVLDPARSAAVRRRGRLVTGLLLLGVVGAAMTATAVAVEPQLSPLLELAGETEGFFAAAALAYGSAGLGSPVGLLWAVGVACAALAATGLLGATLPAAAVRLLAPLRAAGAAPLTGLLVHLVLGALLGGLGGAPVLAHGWGSAAIQLAVVLGVGVVLAATRRLGPVEALVELASERYGGFTRAAVPLEHTLPDDTSIAYSRTYAAPVERVWRAMTDPMQAERWMPHPAMPMRDCTMDVRPGGGFRYDFGALGRELVGHYPQVHAPWLLVTHVVPPSDVRQPYVTVDRLEAQGDRTVHHVRDIFASRAERDSALPVLPYISASLARLARHVEEGDGAPWDPAIGDRA